MKFYKLLFLVFIISCQHTNNNQHISVIDLSVNKIKSMAEDSYENDDYIKSIQLFSKLIEFDSSNGEYYYKRGSSYTMILYADSAIKDLKKSAILKYRVASSYHNIGLNYSTINDSLAVYYFEKSLQIRPTDNKTKKLLGECKERLKNKHNRNKVTI